MIKYTQLPRQSLCQEKYTPTMLLPISKFKIKFEKIQALRNDNRYPKKSYCDTNSKNGYFNGFCHTDYMCFINW